VGLEVAKVGPVPLAGVGPKGDHDSQKYSYREDDQGAVEFVEKVSYEVALNDFLL
jgi:hypothetical protein